MLALALALAGVALYFVTGCGAPVGLVLELGVADGHRHAPGERPRARRGRREALPRHVREVRRARRSAPTRAATPSARGRPTGCCSPPRSATRSASTRSGTGPRTTCAARRAASRSSGRTARWRTPRRRPTPTWTPRARCSSPPAASDRPGCARRRSSSARRSWTSETADGPGAPVLVAGPWAARTPRSRSTRATSRPPRSRRSANATGDGRWGSPGRELADAVTDLLMPDPGNLPPDWARHQGRQAGRRAAPPAEPERRPAYGFDAARTLVRFAEDPRPGRDADRRASAWPAFEGRPPADIPVEHDLQRQAGGQHAAPDGARRGCRRRPRPPVRRPTRRSCWTPRRRSTAAPDLLRRRVGRARADHARHPRARLRLARHVVSPTAAQRVRPERRRRGPVGRPLGQPAADHLVERLRARRAAARAPTAARR